MKGKAKLIIFFLFVWLILLATNPEVTGVSTVIILVLSGIISPVLYLKERARAKQLIKGALKVGRTEYESQLKDKDETITNLSNELATVKKELKETREKLSLRENEIRSLKKQVKQFEGRIERIPMVPPKETVERRALNYLRMHGGEIVPSECAKELELNEDEVRRVLTSLVREGKIRERK